MTILYICVLLIFLFVIINLIVLLFLISTTIEQLILKSSFQKLFPHKSTAKIYTFVKGKIARSELQSLFKKQKKSFGFTFVFFKREQAFDKIWIILEASAIVICHRNSFFSFVFKQLFFKEISKLEIIETSAKTVMFQFKGMEREEEHFNFLYEISKNFDYIKLFIYFKDRMRQIRYKYYRKKT